MGPAKTAGALGLLAGTALIMPFLPGALIPSQRPEELEDIYSGKKEVAVKKGRWWEFGRSPWEGTKTMYYRPHWYPRMLMRAREKSIYGEEEGELSPLTKWFKREFTYDLEREHFADRPYPITSLPFEDVPLLGPLLANTIGRLIKPPRLMHTSEWQNQQGEVVMEPAAFGQRVMTEAGELPTGMPVSPYAPTSALGEQIYRMTEMAGLLGYTATSIKESLTGSQDFFDQAAQLESARRMFGAEREFYDLELGGMAGLNEFYRRLIPHRRRQIDLYNPIRNQMPKWLPGPGERGPNLQYGDPYSQIQEGELRLPGEGYVARFPELAGIAPEDYPDIHKYKILADVGPYTDKFKSIGREIEARRKSSDWSDYEENIYQQTRDQLKEKQQRKQFNEYEYLSPTGGFNESDYYPVTQASKSAELLTAVNKMKAEKEPEQSWWSKLFGGYWEGLSHGTELPTENLTPFAPGAKFMHQRSAIEDYERSQVYGTDSAFWNRPWENFIKPFLQTAAHSFGYEGVPESIQERRQIQSYFDVLKYVKASRLANQARLAGDIGAVKEFEAQKDETLFGVNPYTQNYTSLYRSLPGAERDYFEQFSKADTEEERQKILKLVPENEQGLYLARWKLQLAQDIKAAVKAGNLSEKQLEQAEETLSEIKTEAKVEGFPYNEELFNEYTETRNPGESYGDWYRRTKILPEVPLPGPDWVGWHPYTDLEDIKLKLVQHRGEDMHDYGLWESRAKVLANKPYIDQKAIEAILDPGEPIGQEKLNDLLLSSKVRATVHSRPSFGQKDTYEVDLQQRVDIASLMKDLV
jgi:hypothetical protein